jgi:hypothetical protein
VVGCVGFGGGGRYGAFGTWVDFILAASDGGVWWGEAEPRADQGTWCARGGGGEEGCAGGSTFLL